jgi:acrylyl-CoA reductase (NADPH)
VTKQSGRALEHGHWAAAVDPVGGPMLGQVLKAVRYGGMVALIGRAGGVEYQASVLPFILRSVTLAGIDSVMAPFAARHAAWEALAELFSPAAYEPLVREVRLDELPRDATQILEGGVAGRVVVDVRRSPADSVP